MIRAMAGDKYSAVWVSYSSGSDYLRCPRLYYLNNVYRDPSSGHKISVVTPPLSLGQSVHQVLDEVSVLPTKSRLEESLIARFERVWESVKGKRGGFGSEAVERRYKQRGAEMLRRVMANPGPIARPAVKIKQELPYFFLSEEENIILCGKIDWLEYLPESDGVHVIDFKTGNKNEAEDSLQLPIYLLLASECQKRKVERASYWYLARSDSVSERELPGKKEAMERVVEVAKKIALARKIGKYKCPEGEGGCRWCTPLERVVGGEGEKVAESEYGQDVYFLPTETMETEAEVL